MDTQHKSWIARALDENTHVVPAAWLVFLGVLSFTAFLWYFASQNTLPSFARFIPEERPSALSKEDILHSLSSQYGSSVSEEEKLEILKTLEANRADGDSMPTYEEKLRVLSQLKSAN